MGQIPSPYSPGVDPRVLEVMNVDRHIPDVTIKRLPSYMRVLGELSDEGTVIVSSAEMGRRTGFSSEQIRKDLAYFGAFGTRGVGYEVDTLQRKIRAILGLERALSIALVGAGNLGRALAQYNRTQQQHMQITHIFDVDEDVVGESIAGIEVQHVDLLEDVLSRNHIKMAVVSVPAHAAQEVIDILAAGDVRAVLNFAPTLVDAPENLVVKSVDLTVEMQSLAYYARQRAQEDMEL